MTDCWRCSTYCACWPCAKQMCFHTSWSQQVWVGGRTGSWSCLAVSESSIDLQSSDCSKIPSAWWWGHPIFWRSPFDLISRIKSWLTWHLPQGWGILLNFPTSAAGTAGKYPSAALVQIYQEPDAVFAKLRRLRLIIIDLLHPRRDALPAEKYIYQQMIDFREGRVSSTTPIPLVSSCVCSIYLTGCASGIRQKKSFSVVIVHLP